MTNFRDVGEFHAKFGLPRVNGSNGGPREWDYDLIKFRYDFMLEELDEFGRGFNKHDHGEMFDALLDLVYVAMGTAHLLGYPWQEGWDKVQTANLGKVRATKDGSDSKRGSQWDVVKPKGWQPPDIAAVLRRHGFET